MGAVVFSLTLTLLVLYTPLSIAFGTVPLGLNHWALIIPLCLIAFLTPIYRFLHHESEGECEEEVGN